MRAVDMQRFTPEQLAAPQKCMCGKDTRLADCLISWNSKGCFATCELGCLIVHLSEGRC